jgi:hypothetical protein
MHGKFPAIQQNQRNSILFHETIPLRCASSSLVDGVPVYLEGSEGDG